MERRRLAVTSARTELRKRLGCILRPKSPSRDGSKASEHPTPGEMVAQTADALANSYESQFFGPLDNTWNVALYALK